MPIASSQKVTTLPSGIELAAGQITSLSNAGGSGTNTAVGAVYETVHNLGGIRNELYANYLNEDTGQTLKISSSSTSDTNSGSGAARKVQIRGTGPNGEYLQENVNLNGTTAVETTNAFTSVNRFFVTAVGSGGSTNVGDLTLYKNDGTTALMKCDADTGSAVGAFYYVPAGEQAYLTQIYANAINDCEVTMFVRKYSTNANAPGAWQRRYTMVLNNNGMVYDVLNSFRLNAGDTIEIRAKRLGSTDAKVNADISLVREQ